jgi:hypothetical protein
MTSPRPAGWSPHASGYLSLGPPAVGSGPPLAIPPLNRDFEGPSSASRSVRWSERRAAGPPVDD